MTWTQTFWLYMVSIQYAECHASWQLTRLYSRTVSKLHTLHTTKTLHALHTLPQFLLKRAQYGHKNKQMAVAAQKERILA